MKFINIVGLFISLDFYSKNCVEKNIWYHSFHYCDEIKMCTKLYRPKASKLGIVYHACHPSTWEAEARMLSEVKGQLGIQGESVSQRNPTSIVVHVYNPITLEPEGKK